ncbi:hypothetical protein N7533_006600 [Penicillium manginii]|jgi:hypothetical protein|uniref:uncharacterized protein n=1 Tax=Penicillium manginii TaxID=203109 RepID=UPI002547F253|nr:uncharacterized protein N7533_006600 [Penicillium manginii]KAJ5749572.1 hypothetical protein N7533_006600 [Penicillium manginii]
MKYITAISILITLASSTPTWLPNDTPVNSMKLQDVLGVYVPCMKTCGMTSMGCESQTGAVASTCTHDMAVCMLNCQKMVYPHPIDVITECTRVSVDELSSGLDIDMVESHLKDCVKK